MSEDKLIIKPIEYHCPVHGVVGSFSVVTFSSTIDFGVKRFCIRCCFEKMVEIGVCEVVVEKKP